MNMAEAEEVQDKPRKVQDIARGFLVMGDELLAQKMQNEEYGKKYEFNREERQLARQDVPLAMKAHTEEELKLQKESFERLERLKNLAEEDAELARQLQENEMATLKRKKKNMEVMPAEMVTVSRTMDFLEDGEMVQLEQQKEMLEKQKNKIQQEIKDQEFAIELHNREMKKHMSTFGNPSYRSSEKRLPHSHQINEGKLGGKVISMSQFDGFNVMDGIPEEEKRELIRMQDEELARALQMSEEMKMARRKHSSSSDQMERKDAEMARLMQQAENMQISKSGYNDVANYGSLSSSAMSRHSLENSINHRTCPHHHHHQQHVITNCSPQMNFHPTEEGAFGNASRVETRKEYTKSTSLFEKSQKR